jgi:hypothetical protein
MTKRILTYPLLLIFGILLGLGIQQIFAEREIKNSKEEKLVTRRMADNYKILSPPLPGNPKFAGEKVMLHDEELKERFEREILVNTFWHSQTILLLKRANRWFPTIEKILQENNIPEDFKYLALIESGLLNVISNKDARGFWQFLEETGKNYGLEINKTVDERYHIEKSTLAACKYLMDAKNNLGNWTLAAASYNMGIAGIRNQINKQKTDDYYQLYLNDETARYIFRILAMKAIYENPEKYGFFLDQDELYTPVDFQIVTIDTSIENLIDFAHKNNYNYKDLRLLNPWIRDINFKNTAGKKYELKVRYNS